VGCSAVSKDKVSSTVGTAQYKQRQGRRLALISDCILGIKLFWRDFSHQLEPFGLALMSV
jgi:hypothetical protein